MKKVFSIMMVAFAMVATMVSCDKDKDNDEASETGTYIASAEVTTPGTLSSPEVSVLNQTLRLALSEAKYENTKLEDAIKDLNTRLGAHAEGIAQSEEYCDQEFIVTVYLKNAAGENKATWAISCKDGEARVEQATGVRV